MEAAIQRWHTFRQQAHPPNSSNGSDPGAGAEQGQHRHHAHAHVHVHGTAAPARRMLGQSPGSQQLAQAVTLGLLRHQMGLDMQQGHRTTGAGAKEHGIVDRASEQSPGSQQLAQAVTLGLLRHQLGLESRPGHQKRASQQGQESAGKGESLPSIMDRTSEQRPEAQQLAQAVTLGLLRHQMGLDSQRGPGIPGAAEGLYGIVDRASEEPMLHIRPREGSQLGTVGGLAEACGAGLQWLWRGVVGVQRGMESGVWLSRKLWT